jgi:hypothetical protein
MKLGIGHPATTLVRAGKRRDFCLSLAACGGGVLPCTRVTLDARYLIFRGRGYRDEVVIGKPS